MKGTPFWNMKYFWIRCIGANAMGEMVFSIVCGLISYYKMVNFGLYLKLTIDVWLFKMVYISILSYPLSGVVYLLLKAEKIESSPRLNFNPFKKESFD